MCLPYLAGNRIEISHYLSSMNGRNWSDMKPIEYSSQKPKMNNYDSIPSKIQKLTPTNRNHFRHHTNSLDHYNQQNLEQMREHKGKNLCSNDIKKSRLLSDGNYEVSRNSCNFILLFII